MDDCSTYYGNSTLLLLYHHTYIRQCLHINFVHRAPTEFACDSPNLALVYLGRGCELGALAQRNEAEGGWGGTPVSLVWQNYYHTQQYSYSSREGMVRHYYSRKFLSNPEDAAWLASERPPIRRRSIVTRTQEGCKHHVSLYVNTIYIHICMQVYMVI